MKRVLSVDNLSVADDTDSSASGLCSDVIVNSQQKPKKPRRQQQITNEQRDAIEEAIDKVISQAQEESATDCTNQVIECDPGIPVVESDMVMPDLSTIPISDLLTEIKSQRGVIEAMQATINLLLDKVTRVCDFLGLTSNCERCVSETAASNINFTRRTDGELNKSSEQPGADVTEALSSAATSVVELDGSQSSRSVNVTRHMVHARNGATHGSKSTDGAGTTYQGVKTLADVVLNTLHRDSLDRAKRARSVILSGLQESDNEDNDSKVVRDLLWTEFNYDPSALVCRRLGQLISGRSRCLLVTLPASEEASWLVSTAHRLRKSRDPSIRQNVYINKNLSKAEQHIAYEDRCRRRAVTGLGKRDGHRQSMRVIVNSNSRSDYSSRTDYRMYELDANIDDHTEFPVLTRELSFGATQHANASVNNRDCPRPTSSVSIGLDSNCAKSCQAIPLSIPASQPSATAVAAQPFVLSTPRPAEAEDLGTQHSENACVAGRPINATTQCQEAEQSE